MGRRKKLQEQIYFNIRRRKPPNVNNVRGTFNKRTVKLKNLATSSFVHSFSNTSESPS